MAQEEHNATYAVPPPSYDKIYVNTGLSLIQVLDVIAMPILEKLENNVAQRTQWTAPFSLLLGLVPTMIGFPSEEKLFLNLPRIAWMTLYVAFTLTSAAWLVWWYCLKPKDGPATAREALEALKNEKKANVVNVVAASPEATLK